MREPQYLANVGEMKLNAGAGQDTRTTTPCLYGQVIDVGVNRVVINVFDLIVMKKGQDVSLEPVVVVFLCCLGQFATQ